MWLIDVLIVIGCGRELTLAAAVGKSICCAIVVVAAPQETQSS